MPIPLFQILHVTNVKGLSRHEDGGGKGRKGCSEMGGEMLPGEGKKKGDSLYIFV